MARRKNDDVDTAQAVLAFVVVGGLLGWFTAAQTFVRERLPLFVALAVTVVALLVLVVRRRFVESQLRAARQRALDQHVGSTDGMPGPDFERLVARLMRRDGFTDVRIPGGSGDLGADVVGRAPSGLLVVVQCKRFGEHRSVSSPEMQTFLGTCFHEHGADEAWFVTTTRFSGPARKLGTRRGLHLVDRQALARWMAGEAGPAGTTRGGEAPVAPAGHRS